MVLDSNLLREKLIDAWKLRSDETSFSASLSPLIAECQSEDEFRNIFTTQILTHLDSTISSNLLQSYFKFHARSGYINELLVIEHLISLSPSASVETDDVQIKFLIELLYEILKSEHITAEHGVLLGKQINLLAQWLCSALCVYSNQFDLSEESSSKSKEMVISVSNLFLVLFTNPTLYCLWLMIIKAQKEQNHWKHIREQVLKQIQTKESSIQSDVYEQILFKITRLHLSEEFHHEDIEFNVSIFNPTVSTLVINQLHRSSSILLVMLRFYEYVSSNSNPSSIYLRLLQSSFGGYAASVSTNNSEYQQRWSAFVHFQLPRILASCFPSQFHTIKQAIETFLLHNEYLLNRLDELCVENIFERVFRTTLNYVAEEIKIKYQTEIEHLNFYIQQIRRHFIQQIQQHYQSQPTRSYIYEILQSQMSLEKNLTNIFSNPTDENNLNILVNNLTEYIPLICALDQYYELVDLLLSLTQTQFDLSFYVLCYLTLIVDDSSEDFGRLEIHTEHNSPKSIVYIWLKKYWLARDVGHALFASSLDSIDFLSTSENSFETEKNEFLSDMKTFECRYSSCEYLRKTIFLLGDLQSLVLDETKQILIELINYLTTVSSSSLVHVLLWLFANHQIASDDERIWIQNVIHSTGSTLDSTSTISHLLDAIKRQLWSQFIDNPLLPYYTLNPILSSSSIVNHLSILSCQTSTVLIQSLFDNFVINESFTSEQARALFICSKYVPIDFIIVHLLIHINTSNGIYETNRALYLIFSLILFRRRSSTRCLLEQTFPYLFNIKSNEFMLEPNVYIMCLILNILLMLELNPSNDELFQVKSWRETNVKHDHDDTSVVDGFQTFLNSSSNELFSSDTLRPVNYFLGWFQTILWMFSRTAQVLKPFIKPKLVAQLSEYLPLQFPIEKVLSVLELSTDEEIAYASMVITRDYSHLQTLGTRTNSRLKQNHSLPINEHFATSITENVYSIPSNL